MPEIVDQPAPVPSDRTPIVDLVVADLADRKQLGIQRYGTPLQPFNGRNALIDAYQEALDLACYLRQAIEEQTRPPVPDDMYRACAAAAYEAQPRYVPDSGEVAQRDWVTALLAEDPDWRAAIDHAVRAGRERADAENHDRGYRVGYDIGYAEGRRHADAERADTCGTRDISCTCPTHGTDAPAQTAASGTTPPGEGDPVGAGISGAQRGAEAVELLPGCPVEVWDGPYLSRCSLGAKVLRCAYHGPFERAQRCRLDPACQRPVGHRGPCWPREADHGSAGAGTSGAQRGAQAVVDVNICRRSERVDDPTAHSWRFDGDDPRIVCVYCGQIRDSQTGRVIRDGAR